MARPSSLVDSYLYHKDCHNIHAGYVNSQYVYYGVLINVPPYTYLLFAYSILHFTHHMILQD